MKKICEFCSRDEIFSWRRGKFRRIFLNFCNFGSKKKSRVIFLSFFGILAIFSTPVFAGALPRANFSVFPSSVEILKPITFDASGSRTASGERGNLEFRWRIGNSKKWTNFSSNPVRKFVPGDVGNFLARVEVRDRRTGQVSLAMRNFRVVESFDRRAWIRVKKSSVVVGESVDFELIFVARATDDPDEILVRWDFNSDGIWDTGFSRKKRVSHIFSARDARSFSPTAEVSFGGGKPLKIRKIEVAGGQFRDGNFAPKLHVSREGFSAPILDISPGNRVFSEKTPFVFSVETKNLPSIAWIEWNFEGKIVKNRRKIVHRFSTPGKHRVAVAVCFNRANPVCERSEATVVVEADPVNFRAEISNVRNLSDLNRRAGATPGDRVEFLARTVEIDGARGKFWYRWDFDGDGKWDTPLSERNRAVAVFSREGDFQTKVQIQSDSDDLVAEAVVLVKIRENSAPNGNFSIEGGEIFVRETVRFLPEIFDRETPKSDLEIRWDFDGDGRWDTNFRKNSPAEWVFSREGKFLTKMQIRDSSGATKTITKEVSASEEPEVVARATISARSGKVGEVFRFAGDRSSGRGLEFFWKFADEEAPVRGRNVSRRFATPGEHRIGLRVVDRRGREDAVWFLVRAR